MKYILFSVALSSAVVSTAYAAVPAELKVSGTIAVPACSIAAADDGAYDFGDIETGKIQQNTETPLPSQAKTWTISCDATTYLTYKVLDNRPNTETTDHNENFGLGLVNNDGKLGFYKVTMAKGKVDGVDTMVYSDTDSDGLSTSSAATKTLAENGNRRFGWSVSSDVVKQGKLFVMDLAVAPTLGSQKAMKGPLTANTPLDGSLTLTFALGL